MTQQIDDVHEDQVPQLQDPDGQADDQASEAVGSEPLSYTQREQAHYRRICDEELRVDELERDYTAAAERAKNKKKLYEAAVAELRSLIARGPDAQLELFPEPDGPDEPDTEVEADAWREVPLLGLGLSGPILASLAEADITTIGHVADWTGAYTLTDIAGIGPAKAQQIEDALVQWWAEHPEYTAAAEEEVADDE